MQGHKYVKILEQFNFHPQAGAEKVEDRTVKTKASNISSDKGAIAIGEKPKPTPLNGNIYQIMSISSHLSNMQKYE